MGTNLEPARRRSRSARLIPDAAGLPVLGIEVTQAVQDLHNSVTLVAGKTTVVRVYLDASFLANSQSISGELAWRRGDRAEAYLPALNQVRLRSDRQPTLIKQRHNLDASLNFLLPADAIAEGSLTLRLNRLYVPGGDDVPIADVSPVTVDFLTMPPLILRLIGLRYRVGASGAFVAPNAVHIAYFRSYLARTYPVAEVTWTYMLVDADFAAPFNNDAPLGPITAALANAQLAALRSREVSAGFDPRTHYYGLVDDNGGRDFMRGLSFSVPDQPRPDTVASGPAGVPTGGYMGDLDISYADWYGAHELGHTFGRAHPGFPTGDQDASDPDFPYPNGQISTDDDRYVGFDVGFTALNLPMQALPGRIYHDVMTYGEKQWLSAHTYEGIRLRLFAEAALNLGTPAPFGRVAGGGLADASADVLPSRPEGAARLESRLTRGQFVHVVAALDLHAGTGQILYVNPAAAAIEGSASNEHGIELQFTDAAGQILFSRTPQVLINACEDAAAPRTGLISEDVPLIQGMKEVLLLMHGQVQSRYVAGEIDLPVDAEITLGGALPGRPHRRALVGSPEARRSGVTYTVQARRAGQAIWQTIAVGRSIPDTEVNLNQFPSAEQVEVRVLMTNGFEERILAEHKIVVGDLHP
jgi:hypothetical protein